MRKTFRDRKCLFCENTATTEEHYFSEWLNSLYNNIQSEKVSHQVDKFIEGNGAAVKDGEFAKFSKVLSVRGKVLCGSCNNMWGSDIDNKMSLAFKNIFYVPSVIILEEQAIIIARWLLLKYFLFEAQEEMPVVDRRLSKKARSYANKLRIDDAKKRRIAFKKSQDPFENYRFFISRNSSFDPPFAANFTTAEMYSEEKHGLWMSVSRTFRVFVGPMQAVCTNDLALAAYIDDCSKKNIVPIYEINKGSDLRIAAEEMNFHAFDQFILRFLSSYYKTKSYRPSFMYRGIRPHS